MSSLKRAKFWLASVVVLVGLTGIAPVWAQDSVKIGVIAPFNTPPGEGLLSAARMAAEDINAAGGIGGKPLELVIANDEYKPDIGANAYKKLALSDKVVAVIGTASSGVSLAIVDQMARYKVPMISTGAASLKLSDKVVKTYDRYKYWFRVMHTTDNIARSVGDFVVNHLHKARNLDKAAILSENAVWTNGVLPTINEVLADGGVQVVSEEKFDLDTKDFKPLLAKVRDSGAQFIIDLLFQKAPPQSHTTTDLQPDLPHVPPTQNQTTPVSPNNRLSLARISITHPPSNSPPPDPQHHPD